MGEAAGDAVTRGDSLALLAAVVVAGCAAVVVVLPAAVVVVVVSVVAAVVVVVVLAGTVVALVTALSLLVVALVVAALPGAAVVVAVVVVTGSMVAVASPPPHAASSMTAASIAISAVSQRCPCLPLQIMVPLPCSCASHGLLAAMCRTLGIRPLAESGFLRMPGGCLLYCRRKLKAWAFACGEGTEGKEPETWC